MRPSLRVLARPLLPFALFVGAQLLPAPRLVDVGGAADHRSLDGFRAPIVGQRVSFRWTAPEAELRFFGLSGSTGTLTLRLAAAANSEPVTLRIVAPATGAEVAAFAVPPDWTTFVAPLDETALRPQGSLRTGPVVLQLRADRYRRDADGQEVGVKLDALRLETKGPRLPVVLLRATLLTWGIAVLALLLLRLAACLPAHRRRLGRAAALAAGVIVTLGLGALMALDPGLAAWALPPLPVTSLLGTFVLVAAPARRWCAARGRPSGRWPLYASALLVLAALTWLYLRQETTVGLLVLAPAALLLLVQLPRATEEAPPGANLWPKGLFVAGVILVVALSFALRLYRIHDLPEGMWRDEARHGRVALRMIEDPRYRPVFAPEADIPAAGIYAFIPGLLAWGPTPWGLRATSAAAGALTVLPLILLVRRLTRRDDTALLAGGLLAASASHTAVSRLAFTVELHPLCELTALALLARGLEPTTRARLRPVWLAAGGLALGLALHTYHSARLAPLMAILLVVALVGRQALSARWLLRLWPTVVGFALVALPLVLYAVAPESTANARAAQVFLPSHAVQHGRSPLAELDASLGRHLGMLHVRGDSLGRHNLPGQPHLDPVAGLGFLAGLAWLLARGEGRGRFFLAACALGALPSLVSVDGPRTTRAIDLLPYAAVVAAVGWTAWLAPALRAGRVHRLSALLLTAGAAAFGAWSYFVAAPGDPAVWRSFDTVHTRLGLTLQEQARAEASRLADVYLPVASLPNEVQGFLLHGLATGVYDETDLWPEPAGRQTLRLIVPAGDDAAAAHALARRRGLGLRSAQPGRALPDGTPSCLILTFEQPAAGRVQ